MKKFSILIAGCGEVGTATGLLLAKHHKVYGLRRNAGLLPSQITPITANLNDPTTLIELPCIDIIIYCAAPSKNSITNLLDSYTDTYLKGFNNLINALPTPPQHIFFTSSTSVYAQGDHQWVNEQSATLPTTDKGIIMRGAEQQVLNFQKSATVVRFSGIYGKSRLHLFNQVLNGKAFTAEPIQYSNRIHVDDCAGVLRHLINKLSIDEIVAPLYLASDNLPSPINEVMGWLAKMSNSAVNLQTSKRTTPSKRCDNNLLRDSGYHFLHPDFKSGYKEVLANYAQK
ncbi:MAG: nucleoside-diphosphate-sugar epimerase [Oceanospirillaceae bacterium]|jgi:nucleoside-diphosphate-sugar epimerase